MVNCIEFQMEKVEFFGCPHSIQPPLRSLSHLSLRSHFSLGVRRSSSVFPSSIIHSVSFFNATHRHATKFCVELTIHIHFAENSFGKLFCRSLFRYANFFPYLRSLLILGGKCLVLITAFALLCMNSMCYFSIFYVRVCVLNTTFCAKPIYLPFPFN